MKFETFFVLLLQVQVRKVGMKESVCLVFFQLIWKIFVALQDAGLCGAVGYTLYTVHVPCSPSVCTQPRSESWDATGNTFFYSRASIYLNGLKYCSKIRAACCGNICLPVMNESSATVIDKSL